MSSPSRVLEAENTPLVCPGCRGPILRRASSLLCEECGAIVPIVNGIADFAGGNYFDVLPDGFQPPPVLQKGLDLELEGTRRRVRDFYSRLLPQADSRRVRVLDCGCGNGLSVDLLWEIGFEAWGNDVSQLRSWQWSDRDHKDQLVLSDGASLPFQSGYFDAVLSSGVIEHVGVEECPAPNYSVRPRSDRDARRMAFLQELLRVVRPGGLLFVDCPNGLFPYDFWHGNRPGEARRHSRNEGFLPSFREIRELIRKVEPRAEVRALSPYKRLQFFQAAGHTHGRLLSVPARRLFQLMTIPGFRWLSRTALNPFLVVRIVRPA